MFEVRKDDLSSEATLRLLALHLAGMHANSPPDSVYALDLSGLKAPDITVWSWGGNEVVGIGALKELRNGSAEVKSMRTHPDHLRRGVAALLLDHIAAEAKARGLTRLSLEIGSGPALVRRWRCIGSMDFVNGEAFADYQPSAFNQFLHLQLST
jgi:putative acetyltransferase